MWHKWQHFLRKSLILLLFELSVFEPEVWPSSYHIIFYFKQDSRFISWYYFNMGSANIIKRSHMFSHTSKLYFCSCTFESMFNTLFLWFTGGDGDQYNTSGTPDPIFWPVIFIRLHQRYHDYKHTGQSAPHEHKSESVPETQCMEITSHSSRMIQRSLAGTSSNTQLSQNTHVSYFTDSKIKPVFVRARKSALKYKNQPMESATFFNI